MTDTSDVLADLDDLVAEWLTLPEVAERLDLPVNRIRQLLAEGRLAAVRQGGGGPLRVPARFLSGDAVLKRLPGTLTLLRDAGYSEAEAIRWLFTPEETLPGAPVDALQEGRGTEVTRRAQALGF